MLVVIVKVFVKEIHILAIISFRSSYHISSFVYIRHHYSTNYHIVNDNFHICNSDNNNAHDETYRIFDARDNNNDEGNRVDDDNAYNNENDVIVSFDNNIRYY